MTRFSESLPVRVYYEDTDHGGVVYYANYLKFMERGRTEFLRAIGLELDSIESAFGVLFAVSEAHVRYQSPARFNDLLDVDTALIELRGARLAFSQTIYHQASRRELCTATIRLACISRDGSVSRIPAPLSEKLQNHLNKEHL
ncbi:MAG: tol-pal system-associated acyl-CoA thioesterase [Zetaproteobacteria bacterium CG12_big_fil_rev_8_21_14_0_65_54_13]|nr:MAG: tol-pal system-associated acyl-CoA thioesterase [Zetaproteobacteria bacterium CG12_big_fil_rev_8_21_14_0_65_54_13]PIX53812.1 MAG: tol-pal system-associated acyl-CoA thioesterase [Zetaproteobacteria bacterium CG_4_10_14_3_um_filter_54_28]PJA30846.1 MAG: tol-pal system-associated acyl-CoA thioesterase [Zetaproteobacteria bacterium CG_4_9_14_3_um_filter_54_145]